jgi:hypothetical protein
MADPASTAGEWLTPNSQRINDFFWTNDQWWQTLQIGPCLLQRGIYYRTESKLLVNVYQFCSYLVPVIRPKARITLSPIPLLAAAARRG